MTKEELLNEMYGLIKKFDRDMIDLMNLMRNNGELKDEITAKDNVIITEKTNNDIEPKVGDVVEGVVDRILSKVGAFVKLSGGAEGLIHISKMSKDRIDKVEDVLEYKNKVRVKIIKKSDKGIDLELLEILDR